MRYYKYINGFCFLALVISFSGLLPSCKKLIEIPANPPDKLRPEQVFSDSANVMSAIAGIYTSFKTVNNYSFNLFNGGMMVRSALSGDELVNSATYDQEETPFYTNALLPNNNYVTTMWSEAYTALYQVNACLEGINSTTAVSEGLKKQLTGEIKLVRAFYYFNLANLYGPVPLVTNTVYATNAKLPRASLDSVYNQVINDLKDATQLLGSGYPSAGRARPNVYTAYAFLAKVYLYRKQWAEAAAMANLVIKSNVYSLETDLNRVFLSGSTEAIWQLPARGTNSQTLEAVQFIPPSYNPTGMPKYTFTAQLVNAFEANDGRKANWAKTQVVGGITYYYPYKYKVTGASPLEDYMIFRLGEQYLVRAEALLNQSLTDSAFKDLNKVRTRAGLPNSPVPAGDLMNAILHERQTELFCEWSNRWFDLKRTGKADGVLKAIKPGWQATDTLYPIPILQIQSNPALKQNDGYN